MRIIFHPAALDEFENATLFYKEKEMILGERFRDTIRSLIEGHQIGAKGGISLR
jgi:hypothetical protein